MSDLHHIPDGVGTPRRIKRVPTQEQLERAIRRGIARNVGYLTVVAIVILIVWFVWDVLLYGFCGVLIAVAFRACVSWLAQKTGFGEKSSYAVVLVVTILVAVAAAYILAPRLANQTSQIAAELPKAWGRVRAQIERYELGRSAMQSLAAHSNMLRTGALFSRVGGDLFDVAAGLVAALVVGLYAAADPQSYIQALLRLVPTNKRKHVAGVIYEVGDVLKWWLMGQLVPMGVLGVATMIGLSLMQIPLAFTLGLFSGLMIFIPYAGTLLATIPAALMGLLQGKMLWVLAFYLGLHLAEGYALTPLVQRRAIRLPPALTILAQAFMWAVAGLLGVVVATPLVAACLVVIRRILLDKGSE